MLDKTVKNKVKNVLTAATSLEKAQSAESAKGVPKMVEETKKGQSSTYFKAQVYTSVKV